MLELNAKDITPIEASMILGISIRTVYTLSYRYGVNFKRAPYGLNKLINETKCQN